jgi:hypothetical protein
VADDRIPTGPLEQEPTPLFLPVQERLWLAYRALADVRLGTWDQRIVEWLAKSTDTSTLLTILSLLERAKAAALAAERYGQHDRDDSSCPGCTCCMREGCHRGLDSECPYSTVLDRVVCSCTEPLD